MLMRCFCPPENSAGWPPRPPPQPDRGGAVGGAGDGVDLSKPLADNGSASTSDTAGADLARPPILGTPPAAGAQLPSGTAIERAMSRPAPDGTRTVALGVWWICRVAGWPEPDSPTMPSVRRPRAGRSMPTARTLADPVGAAASPGQRLTRSLTRSTPASRRHAGIVRSGPCRDLGRGMPDRPARRRLRQVRVRSAAALVWRPGSPRRPAGSGANGQPGGSAAHRRRAGDGTSRRPRRPAGAHRAQQPGVCARWLVVKLWH